MHMLVSLTFAAWAEDGRADGMAEAVAAVIPSRARAFVRRARPPRAPLEPALLPLSPRPPDGLPRKSIRLCVLCYFNLKSKNASQKR